MTNDEKVFWAAASVLPEVYRRLWKTQKKLSPDMMRDVAAIQAAEAGIKMVMELEDRAVEDE